MDKVRAKIRQIVRMACAAFLIPCTVSADQLRIDSAEAWRQWTLPGDAVDLELGGLKPVFTRRNINAVANASDFAGGIRAVGSNARDGVNLIDGTIETYWAPDLEAPLEDWWIEVDLGRVVSAQRIELHFASTSEPLEFFKILTSDGETFFSNAGVGIEGTLRYNDRRLYSFNQDQIVEIDFGLKPLRHIRIQADKKTPGTQFSELRVESVGDNLSLGAIERGGEIVVRSLIGSGRDERDENPLISRNLVDGDITSYWGRKEGRGLLPVGRFTLDLGVLYWIDRVRLLGDFTGLPTTGEQARARFGSINYLWYHMTGSDGSLAPDGSLRWVSLGELPESPRNQRDIVHFEERFPLMKLRYIRLLFGMTTNALSGTTAEIQTFGEGFPAELTARSPIYDLGGEKAVSTISWRGTSPPATRVEIRSRTGNALVEEYVFYDKNGKGVTERKYDKLIPSFRGKIDTVRASGDDWSNWSRAYDTSGQFFLSPGPRRYVQLETRFLSDDPSATATLDDISLDFGNPLAEQTRAEVFPRQALPGEKGEFTYYLQSDLDATSLGFDQIELSSSADLTFLAIRVDGESASVDLENIDGGFKLSFANAIARSALVEIDFESTLYLNQTRFDANLFNSALTPTGRQQVDPGDASADIESEQVFVSLPIDERLFSALTLSTRIFTPNGDGIGDHLLVKFDLLKVLNPRPVELGVYDMSGRRVALISDAAITAGRQKIVCDGRNPEGRTVPPGLYILQIEVAGDALTHTESRLISVVY
jgi:hypothetical protein